MSFRIALGLVIVQVTFFVFTYNDPKNFLAEFLYLTTVNHSSYNLEEISSTLLEVFKLLIIDKGSNPTKHTHLLGSYLLTYPIQLYLVGLAYQAVLPVVNVLPWFVDIVIEISEVAAPVEAICAIADGMELASNFITYVYNRLILFSY